ncbi:NUDIX hydrolase [Planococcus sp. FY231025]|uniref:NUDIX hydrolase n=1 Tax=Planococcus sp. FY231025 TaxID=3455699 RepID=UPI003F9280B8
MEMSDWKGAAGVCVNEKNEVLLVLQNISVEDGDKWAVPAGGVEPGESLEESCKREFFEETGLEVAVLEELKVKSGQYENFDVSFNVHYFRVEVTGGELNVHDPFGLILDVAWKPVGELDALEMAYPDDRALIQSLVKN